MELGRRLAKSEIRDCAKRETNVLESSLMGVPQGSVLEPTFNDLLRIQTWEALSILMSTGISYSKNQMTLWTGLIKNGMKFSRTKVKAMHLRINMYFFYKLGAHYWETEKIDLALFDRRMTMSYRVNATMKANAVLGCMKRGVSKRDKLAR